MKKRAIVLVSSILLISASIANTVTAETTFISLGEEVDVNVANGEFKAAVIGAHDTGWEWENIKRIVAVEFNIENVSVTNGYSEFPSYELENCIKVLDNDNFVCNMVDVLGWQDGNYEVNPTELSIGTKKRVAYAYAVPLTCNKITVALGDMYSAEIIINGENQDSISETQLNEDNELNLQIEELKEEIRVLTERNAELEEENSLLKEQLGYDADTVVKVGSELISLDINNETVEDSEKEQAPESDFLYVSNGSIVEIKKYVGNGGLVVIPDTIEGVPVVSIAEGAFKDCETVTGIVLPNSLEKISDSAFAYLDNLSGILIFPETMTEIGGHVFQCTNITGVVIQSDCKIDVNAFANNDSLEFFYIKEGCSPSIGTAVFGYDENFTTMILPNTVSSIKDETFKACNALVFYTPQDSYAASYASNNLILCNNKDYESKAAEYYNLYCK